VSRWNFEVKVKNATLRSVKKLGPAVQQKKNTYTLASTKAECHWFPRAPIPPRSWPPISEQ